MYLQSNNNSIAAGAGYLAYIFQGLEELESTLSLDNKQKSTHLWVFGQEKVENLQEWIMIRKDALQLMVCSTYSLISDILDQLAITHLIEK